MTCPSVSFMYLSPEVGRSHGATQPMLSTPALEMVVHTCHVGSDIIRHLEASRPWCQRRPQLTSICGTAMGKFLFSPFFYPHLHWEQEAIKPRLKGLQSPSQCLSLSLVTMFCLLLLSP